MVANALQGHGVIVVHYLHTIIVGPYPYVICRVASKIMVMCRIKRWQQLAYPFLPLVKLHPKTSMPRRVAKPHIHLVKIKEKC